MIKRKYRTAAKMMMQTSLEYRFNYIFNILGSFIFILSLLFLWRSIFTGGQTMNGFTWQGMKTYLFVTYISNAMVSWMSETRISLKIRDGSIAMDLIKPVDFQKLQLSQTVGSLLIESVAAVGISSVIILLFGKISLPVSGWNGFFFLLSMMLSFLIKFGIVYLCGLLCFWTTSHVGIAWARAAVTNLFSGALVPLTFFPGWLQKLAAVLPFQGIVHIPANIYLQEVFDLMQCLRLISLQLFWCILLWFAGKFLWAYAVKKITIHGG